MFHTKKDSKRKRGVSQNVNKITILGIFTFRGPCYRTTERKS